MTNPNCTAAPHFLDECIQRLERMHDEGRGEEMVEVEAAFLLSICRELKQRRKSDER